MAAAASVVAVAVMVVVVVMVVIAWVPRARDAAALTREGVG